MKPELPPVFLLEIANGEEAFDPREVESMVEAGEIKLGSLAAVEGMPAWRSVTEALVWSRAKLANSIRHQFIQQVDLMVAGQTDLASARLALRDACATVPFLPSPSEMAALQLVLQVNAALRHSLRQHNQGATDESLELYPAQELTFIEKQEFPRDWLAAWQEAGGQLFGGRMIARRDSPVWVALSDFGFPCPPLSLEPAAWVQEVERDEAESLGVLAILDEVILPPITGDLKLIGVDM